MSTDDERLLARLGETLRGREQREGAAAREAQLASADTAQRQPPGDDIQRELFAPLPASFRDALAERALQALGRGQPAPAIAPPAPARRFRRRLLGPTFAVAFASAAAAWLLWPSHPLPVYSLAVEGGDEASRAEPVVAPGGAGRVALTTGSRIELLLRPATPAKGRVAARLYLDGSPPVPLDHATEVAPSGAVRWSGTAGQLVGSRTGDLDVLLIVGRPSALPPPDEIARHPDGPGPGWQSFRARLRVVSER